MGHGVPWIVQPREMTPSGNVDGRSEQFCEFLDREAGLANDRAQRAGFEGAVAVHGGRNGSSETVGMNEEMVTANDPLHTEARLAERPHHPFAIDDRKSSTAHIRLPT